MMETNKEKLHNQQKIRQDNYERAIVHIQCLIVFCVLPLTLKLCKKFLIYSQETVFLSQVGDKKETY